MNQEQDYFSQVTLWNIYCYFEEAHDIRKFILKIVEKVCPKDMLSFLITKNNNENYPKMHIDRSFTFV